MVKIPDFKKDDWEKMNAYIASWQDRKGYERGDPSYALYNLPLTAALLPNAEAMEKLTSIIIGLTIIVIGVMVFFIYV